MEPRGGGAAVAAVGPAHRSFILRKSNERWEVMAVLV